MYGLNFSNILLGNQLLSSGLRFGEKLSFTTFKLSICSVGNTLHGRTEYKPRGAQRYVTRRLENFFEADHDQKFSSSTCFGCVAMSSTSMLRGSDAALKRLHVSGLSASHCSAEDIRHRFTSFGVEVVNIYNWPPRQDAVGNQTDWCFVSVKGNEPNISRATSILNGTMWKGSKLRVGIAKPQRFNDASSADSSNENGTDPANDEKKQKKQREKTNRSRLRRGIAGVEGEDVAKPVQVEDVDRGLWVGSETT